MTRRKKILLVDDAETVLLMERMILQGEPYDVVTARDGDEAIAQALAERPDLILLDIVMPKKDGFEVCRLLRSHADTRHTPILLVSTRGEPQNVEAGFASGCNDFITKPVDRLVLLSKIRSHLGG
ncbi:MAG TPA: response regulator [Candidatus Binatia bacterium]|nr:response regulator [Candidatus Binatia bacterium]